MGWLEAAADADDEESAAGRAHVRDDSGETLEVIVLVEQGEDLVIPPWVPNGGGMVVPTEFTPPAYVAKKAATCTIALPRSINVDAAIADLERQHFYPAWKDAPWLEGQLVLSLDEDGRGRVADVDVHYSRHDGLELETL